MINKTRYTRQLYLFANVVSFAEILFVPQHGSSEIIKAAWVQNDPAMAERGPHRHCDDLANANHMKL